MNVAGVMTRAVRTCHLGDSLNRAAQLMWDNACGCVVVVAGLGKPIGIITDRDICMAAYTQGKPIADLAVSSAASHFLVCARPTDSVEDARERMRQHNLRRLPVTDENGWLLGIVSTFDLPRGEERRQVAPATTVQAPRERPRSTGL